MPPKKTQSKNEKDFVAFLTKSQNSPRHFIETLWKLKPQPVKQEFEEELEQVIKDGDLTVPQADWFKKFEKGKHYTWQQYMILLGIERSLKDTAPRRISVRSGHGIGKSTTLAWLVIWFLFCHKDAKIPCTAPTTEQMNDVLWAEIAKWLKKLPEDFQKMFEWTASHIRISESPETWFARAKTARKESPEALAGVHGDHVMFIIDEASDVPEEIFNTAEGALTEKNILVIMISNPTRLVGYFYDSHHRDKKNWQAFGFSAEDSPLVDEQYNIRIIEKHGEESDEYNIRVKGEFPNEEAVDAKGYVPLLLKTDLKFTNDIQLQGTTYLGVDPSGEGKDETVWVIRDNFKAKIVAKEKVSNEKSIARKTFTLMDMYGVDDHNVTIDNFGIGANVSRELALIESRKVVVNAVNVGNSPSKSKKKDFLNQRAESYYGLKQWLRKGGELVYHSDWDQLLFIRYRREEMSGKMKIMGKQEMRKEGIPSPDVADALMLTFVNPTSGSGGRIGSFSQFTPNFKTMGYGKRR